MGHPTIYPTGVTVYDPERSWNGFTIFQAQEVGAVLMDPQSRNSGKNQKFPRLRN